MFAILAIGTLLLFSIFTTHMPYHMYSAEASFSLMKNLSNTTDFSSDPQIAVSGKDVYVVWTEFALRSSMQVAWADDTAGNWDIFFRASNDNGATFGDTVNLSNNAGESSNPKRSDLPQVAVSGNSVYVVWADDTAGNWDIFFRASNDNGATFGNTVNLSNNTLGISENTVNPSYNGGNESSTKRSDLPQVAVSDNYVYVVWVDYIPGDYDIQFRASNDNGATFGDAVNLETRIGLTDLPQIAVSDNYVYVMWDEFSLAEGLHIFLRASNDNGATFGDAVSLIRNVGYTDSTPVVVSGNNVYVISAVGNIDIFFRASNDNGATFGNAVNLSKNAEASSNPQMVVSGTDVYVVWEDYATGNPEILFSTFIPGTDIETSEKMVLLTDNGSVKVEVTMDLETLETGKPVGFSLKFHDPMTGELLQNVNYSFMIIDEMGNNILNRLNLHANEGIDTQFVTFSNTGSFTLSIDIAGIGINEPYDSTYDGMASTVLTVVPEFPLSIMAVMGIVLGTAIAISRYNRV